MSALPLRVDCKMELVWIKQAMPHQLFAQNLPQVTGICLDSRALKPGDLFFAIKAARNGHDFAAEALAKGAAGVVVDHNMQLDGEIVVDDTLTALHVLAKSYRQSWHGTVVGVSGSNGKTTTKEILQTLLGEKAFATPGTWNNHLGIPLSLFMLSAQHNIAIIEMGINDFGDLQGYCRYALPDVGVLTVIGDSHLMNLKDKQGVLKAKAELFTALSENGMAVVNIDDPYLKPFVDKLSTVIVTVSCKGNADIAVRGLSDQQVEVVYGSEIFVGSFALPGAHNLSNLACALGVAWACKVPAKRLQENIGNIAPLQMRMQQCVSKYGAQVIIDCYNANPTSARAGLTMLSTLTGKKHALLGDMLELGLQSSKIHMDIGRELHSFGVDQLFLIGQFAKDYYQGALLGGLLESQICLLEDRTSAVEKIRAQLQSGDILYVKGSRGMRLEEIIEPLL